MVAKPGSYKRKLHPIFFDLAELNREAEIRFAKMQQECERGLKALGPTPDRERRKKVVNRFEQQGTELLVWHYKKLVEIQSRHGSVPYNKLAYGYFSFDPTSGDDRQGIFEFIHWERHGESLEKTVASVSEGDVSALRRLHRTDEDFLRIAAKKGPIKRFQGDSVHRQLLQLILCYETAPMTKEERADCLDNYCACGGIHDPDAVDKQCRRLKKQLQASASLPKT
jgi:hypothetical protein